jgi:aminopeptidase N
MSSWTLQMGYPLLTITEEQKDKSRVLKIKQKRFIADGSADDENLQWKVPITIFTKSNPKKIAQQILMEQPEISLTLDNVPEDDWIKLNFNSIGLYRVKYESKTLARLNEPIAKKIISPQDRLMVQDDVAALCNAGHQSFVDYLQLLPSYKDEDNFTVWKSIASNMGDLSSLLEYTNYFDEFKKYRLNLFSSIQAKLGWDAKPNEDPLVAMLRPMILSIAGKSGDENVIKEAQKRFKRHVAGDLIDPNIRGAVYVIVSRYGDENTQDDLRKLYTAADMTEEKVRLLRSMGQSTKPEIIQNTLKFIFENDNVRMQDSVSGFVGCTSSRVGRDLVWKFLQENWKMLVERFGEKSSFLISFVEYGLSDFADETIATEIKSFFDSANTPLVIRPVKKVLETIHMRSEVLKRDSKAIEDYLKQQK